MKKHILIVEDEASSQLILKNLLYKDYEVTIKDNGAKALEWLVNGNITDLIITDLEMPVMNGFKMIKILNNSGELNMLPLIITSSMDRAEVFDSDRVDRIEKDYLFLQKPISPNVLNELLGKVLEIS